MVLHQNLNLSEVIQVKTGNMDWPSGYVWAQLFDGRTDGDGENYSLDNRSDGDQERKIDHPAIGLRAFLSVPSLLLGISLAAFGCANVNDHGCAHFVYFTLGLVLIFCGTLLLRDTFAFPNWSLGNLRRFRNWSCCAQSQSDDYKYWQPTAFKHWIRHASESSPQLILLARIRPCLLRSPQLFDQLA